MMKKHLFICLFLYLLDMNYIYSSSATENLSLLHSNCQGLSPVYNNQGLLNGYRGTCHVTKLNGSPSELNSMHSINSDILNSPQKNSIFQDFTSWLGNLFGTSPTASYKHHHPIHFKQRNDKSLFDWLSPHHDLIRNHPHYRQAHLHHRHCVYKKHTGLFDFLGGIFGSGSESPDYNNDFPSINDPYSEVEPGSHCLKSSFYAANPFNLNDSQYDPYSLHLTHKIHHLRHQINSPITMNIDELKNNLYDHYDRLHRHLDCHCHHELPHSRTFKIHHRPIRNHSMNLISQPDMSPNSTYPFQMNTSMNFDPSTDMESEHMTMLRMSGLAAQQAYNMGYFAQNPDSNLGALRMQVFHPVNTYGQGYDDPEWNRLKVEKVIVIKRLKIPVVRNVPVPVPVPVPYPVPSVIGGNENYLGSSGFENVPSGYMGNNMYMVDSIDESPLQMNSVMQAISGAPCGCLTDPIPYDSIQNEIYSPTNMSNEYSSQYMMNQLNAFPNRLHAAHTLMQPGIQILPNPRPIHRKYLPPIKMVNLPSQKVVPPPIPIPIQNTRNYNQPANQALPITS